jgi:hypothetical protein
LHPSAVGRALINAGVRWVGLRQAAVGRARKGLIRHGYDMRSVERSRSPDIADEFRVKPADVRLFLQNQPDPARTRELTEQMLVVELSV